MQERETDVYMAKVSRIHLQLSLQRRMQADSITLPVPQLAEQAERYDEMVHIACPLSSGGSTRRLDANLSLSRLSRSPT